MLHVDYTDRGTTPAGTRRPPSAATVTAIDVAARPLTTVCVRLVGKRAHGVPDGAQEPHSGAQRLSQALHGRTVIVWDGTVLPPLLEGLRSQGAYGDTSPWPASAASAPTGNRSCGGGAPSPPTAASSTPSLRAVLTDCSISCGK
ncbi:hypothetical protein ABZ820_33625 [Streptomyces diacarni]|uniref:hypothetical protein n=1 Tax=Streptomyces diacarni TaxID=2800381 RepID=UPI0033DB3C51